MQKKDVRNAGAVTRKGSGHYNRIPQTNEPAGYSAMLTGCFSAFIGGNKAVNLSS